MYIENLRKILVWGKFRELIKMRLSKTADRENQLGFSDGNMKRDIKLLHSMPLLKVGAREAVSHCMIYVFLACFLSSQLSIEAIRVFYSVLVKFAFKFLSDKEHCSIYTLLIKYTMQKVLYLPTL
jgi:hypothetical protein